MESTFEKIRGFLAEQLGIGPEKITMDHDLLNDFEADSLDIVQMLIAMENEFGVEFDDEEMHNIKTVGDVVAYLKKNVK